MDAWAQNALLTLGVIITALLGYLGVRYTGRSATAATQTMDSATWERRYRHNAERHLKWDLQMMSRLQRVEQQLGINEPITEPPPLFPDADAA
jgi:hypothetical protein